MALMITSDESIGQGGSILKNLTTSAKMELNPPSFISFVTGHGMPARLAKLSQETGGVLSMPAAFGWTFCGGVAAGVFLLIIFALKRWLSPACQAKATSTDEDPEPLLPESATCGPTG
jgi:uncharacterized membrane protein YdcZ (DUF606 family)